MSYRSVAHMFAKYWITNMYICCVCLPTIILMDYQETYQTCEDLACKNSNPCQSSLMNGSLASHAYCTCRGEWVGLTCEVKLIVSMQSISTNKVTLEIHGLTSSEREKVFTFEDLHISEMSVAVLDFNISDQCLLLRQRDPLENVISLGGLTRDQEYLVCVTNGFVDSCSIFSYRLYNTSRPTNCVYFKTILFDEPPFDLGLVAVPLASLICIVVVTVLIYSQRRSLLVQLCLNKVFCRSCYCCRKHIQRRRRLMHKQRDVSGEGLMTPDLPLDFESLSASHTEAAGDSSHGWIHSSNASPSISHRSACSLDEGSVALTASIDQTIFLYEDQSLIPPLYSPQDHKIMTLTYIDEDFIPQITDHSNYTNSLLPRPYTNNSANREQPYLRDITNCSSSKQQFHIPGSVDHGSTGNYCSAITHCQGKPEPCQHTGPVKPQYLIHPYLHRPYDKSRIFQSQAGSNPHGSRFSNSEYGLRYRKSNKQFFNKRPCSLLLTQNHNEPLGNTTTRPSLVDRNSLKHSHTARLKRSHESFHSPVSSSSQIFRSRDNNNPPVCAANPRLTYLLSSPSRYMDISQSDREENIARHCCGVVGNTFSSNTLPRFRKPRFTINQTANNIHDSLPWYEQRSDKPVLSVMPNTSNNIQDFWLGFDKPFKFALPQTVNNFDDCWYNKQNRSNNPFISALPHATSNTTAPWLIPDIPLISSPSSQKPMCLDIPTRDKDQHFETRSRSSTPVAADTTSLSQPKSYNKHVKNLISHFEHNLSFLKSSKSHHTTDEEKEFQELQSPLAEERSKASKKSRRSSVSKSLSRDTPTPTNQNHRHSLTSGVHIFEGHPSEHILPPFSTDDEDDDEEVTETSTNDISDETSSTSLPSVTRQNTISSYDDDESNLVTPFVTDDSSDDDTYKDIHSLSGSMETLQDDNLEAEQSLLS